MTMPKETKAERLARQEVERLEGVVGRRGAKHEDAKRKLSAAKTRQKEVKKKTTTLLGMKPGEMVLVTRYDPDDHDNKKNLFSA